MGLNHSLTAITRKDLLDQTPENCAYEEIQFPNFIYYIPVRNILHILHHSCTEHSPSNKIEMEDMLVATGWLKAKGVGMNIKGNMRCPGGDAGVLRMDFYSCQSVSWCDMCPSPLRKLAEGTGSTV